MTPILRQAFLRSWKDEQREGAWFRSYFADDALLYALGRRGALAALHGIALPPPRQLLAMNFLALGYVRVDERFQDLYDEMFFNQALKEEVAAVLTAHFALSEEEGRTCVTCFVHDYQDRDDATYPFHQADDGEQKSDEKQEEE